MLDKKSGTPDGPTVLKQSTGSLVGIAAAFLLLGAGVGWLVKLGAKWLLTLDWPPFQGPAKLVTSIPEPGLTFAMIGLGALAGLVLAFVANFEELSAEITAEHITLTRKGKSWQFQGRDVALALWDDKQFVLVARDGTELARERTDLPRARLSAALAAHGYAWADEDPHRNEFRRWIPGAAGLPDGAHALLKTRAATLEKGSDDEQLRELRAELARLGVVVRDEKKHQYWRL
ncbi:hypothetical protein ACFYVL_21735 [Streptomyces sp. NPDC004111]|uniref:YqeB family protein n=1 Tax=Streptomyces sp. NPDC004111 TaxID=3364690 RepID=UPI00369CEBA7